MAVGKPDGMPEGIAVGNPEGIVEGNPDGIALGMFGGSGVRTVGPAPFAAVPGAACPGAVPPCTSEGGCAPAGPAGAVG